MWKRFHTNEQPPARNLLVAPDVLRFEVQGVGTGTQEKRRSAGSPSFARTSRGLAGAPGAGPANREGVREAARKGRGGSRPLTGHGAGATIEGSPSYVSTHARAVEGELFSQDPRAGMTYKLERHDGSARVESTFSFVDLAGFTALTEAQGDEDAADVATRFAEIARAALGRRDRLIKTIGDAVFVSSPDPPAAVAFVERLFVEAAQDPRCPSLRAGLHHGEAVERAGDVFGGAVNLAARIASEAYAGEVLGTEQVASAARASGIPVAELGSLLLKNVRKPIPVYSLALVVGATETPVDPVCRMPVDRRAAAGRLRYREREFWFCSLTCAAAFASNPGWHAAESVRPR